jgi:hypothetical protein
LLFLIVGTTFTSARQHKGRPSANAPCEGGILNSRVVFEVEPEYSTEAKKAKAEGTVIIRVRVDEEGKTYEAIACSGHSLLRQLTADAAYRTRLSPTLLSGKPVKVAGVLVYVFKLDEDTGTLYRGSPAPND